MKSGFSHVERGVFQPRLVHVKGKRCPRFSEVYIIIQHVLLVFTCCIFYFFCSVVHIKTLDCSSNIIHKYRLVWFTCLHKAINDLVNENA